MFLNILQSITNEIKKIIRSPIFFVSIGISLFIVLILGLMMYLVIHPKILPPGILQTKINMALIHADWKSYLSFLEIAISALGMILFGIMTAWIFGREYSDHTIKDLLAVPCSRSAIIFSKLITLCLWSIFIGIIIFLFSFPVGFAIKLPYWNLNNAIQTCRVFFIAMALTLLLCPATAFVTSMAKSLLAGIGFVLLCMGLANFFANIGLGSIFPWSIPMLYTGAVETNPMGLPFISYCMVVTTAIAGTIGTILVWKYADQAK